MGIDKLIAQSSLSTFHCQSLRLLRICALFGKDGRRSCWILEEQNSMVFGQQLFQRFKTELMDNLWNSSGRFSQDSLRWESSIRFNRWWENYSVDQRTSQAGSSSCQCFFSTLCGRCKRKWWNTWKQFRQFFSMLVESLAVIGLSLVLDLKRSGTEVTIANQMDLGTELQRKCCWTSQDPVIRNSVVPVLWREEKKEAKKVERSQYTSLAAPETLSCFSKKKGSSPSISLVSTEQ